MAEYLTRAQVLDTKNLSSRRAAKQLGVGKTTVNKYRRDYGIQAADRGVTEPVPSLPQPRILALDLETSPNLAHVWGLWQQNVGLPQLLESTEVICFGARWLGTEEVIFRSVHHDGKEEMLRTVHELLNEADAVMGWNSKGFDVKHLNREFLENDLGPTSPFVDLDLMIVTKASFRFPSNKLDYVAGKLLGQHKVKHSGHQLWIRCMAGDDEAWAEMKEYQIQDVNLLIDLYAKLQPWIKKHPNVGLYIGEAHVCTNCGSDDLEKRGKAYTGSSVYQQYRCRGCGKWQRGAKRDGTTNMRSV